MDRDELPDSTLVGASSSYSRLASYLQKVLGPNPDSAFWSYDIIEGDVRSGRVLYVNRHIQGKTVQFPNGPMGAQKLAAELQKLSRESRYPRPVPPERAPGWEIRQTTIEERPVVICWAAWCRRSGSRS